LLVGESWQTISFHVKRFDLFSNAEYTEAGDYLQAVLETNGIETTYQPCHIAASKLPESREALDGYDVVIRSDIGYNTIAIPPETFSDGTRRPNRLQLLDEYVRDGGGFLMLGGYLSFHGISGRANYAGTAVEEILPITMEWGDDRAERPDGVYPEVIAPDHPLVSALDDPWPDFLGHNPFETDDDAEELVRIDEDPLLFVGSHDSGRSAAFASDCAPHRGPMEFVEWDGYPQLWADSVRWLAGGR
jgi:uncharacterized membrane protein